MKIVVTGSFNGQDSLGDECLLKGVVERVRYQRPQSEIALQLHGSENPFVREFGKALKVQVEQGLQSVMGKISGVLQRLRMPGESADSIANKGAHLAAAVNAFGGRAVIDRLQASDAYFVFGGTQFSGQWFAMNAPAYLKSAEIVSNSGGKVFFGPQQYGPMADEYAATLRASLANVVTDWRTRNRLDLDLLGADPAEQREIYDEVFSATRLYPSLAPEKPKHILVNLRHTTFDTNDVMDAEAYQIFAHLIDRLVDRYNLPVVFFGVSGASFCDDDAAFGAIARFARHASRMESAGRVRDEFHLFDLAREAKLTISMSFHGCLLSGIAGSPFIPVTEGNYYDYKYADFDKYTGNQGVPLVSLSRCDPATDLERIAEYVEKFDADRLTETREAASRLADAFYSNAIGH